MSTALLVLVVASVTAEQGVLSLIPGLGKVLLGFSIRYFTSGHGVWFYARLMAKGSFD